MNEPVARRHSDDECDKWYYDLGQLAERSETNYRQAKDAQAKAETSRKRTLLLSAFVLFAFLLLSWRNEVNADRISDSNDRISATQIASCASGLEILQKFNLQQNELIAIERVNPFIDDAIRAARIKAYEDARIDPLPACDPQP